MKREKERGSSETKTNADIILTQSMHSNTGHTKHPIDTVFIQSGGEASNKEREQEPEEEQERHDKHEHEYKKRIRTI